MSTHSTPVELRKMSAADLRREIDAHRTQLAKTRLSVELRHEKDTSKMRAERRYIARMLTILAQKPPEASSAELKAKPKKGKVSASRSVPKAKRSSSQRS